MGSHKISVAQLNKLCEIKQKIDSHFESGSGERENAILRIDKVINDDDSWMAHCIIEEWYGNAKQSVPAVIKWVNMTIPKESSHPECGAKTN